MSIIINEAGVYISIGIATKCVEVMGEARDWQTGEDEA